jgi:hypothetical protein
LSFQRTDYENSFNTLKEQFLYNVFEHGYRGGDGHVFFAKYTLNLPYIYSIFSSKKNPIFLFNFGQKWLDTQQT